MFGRIVLLFKRNRWWFLGGAALVYGPIHYAVKRGGAEYAIGEQASYAVARGTAEYTTK